MTTSAIDGASHTSRTLLAAGCLQLAALLTPAARMRIVGAIPFYKVPTASVALAVLAALTIAVALRPRGWWRWLPSVGTALVLALTYWRLVYAPSQTFVDPVLRRTLHPSWGFYAMFAAVLVGLIGAALVRAPRAIPSPLPIDATATS